MESAQRIFKVLDINGDGKIPACLLKRVLQFLDAAYFNEERIEAIFKYVDVDGETAIPLERLLNWTFKEEAKIHLDKILASPSNDNASSEHLQECISGLSAKSCDKLSEALRASSKDQNQPLLTSGMQVSLLEATDFVREHVPEGFDSSPRLALLLPGPKWSDLLSHEDHRSFHYHLLNHTGFDMFSPLSFDADAFVEDVLSYCRFHGIQAVTAIDTFPKMLAALVTDELKLPGASFLGTFMCCSKYYMRKFLTPDMALVNPGNTPPTKYPVVVKLADSQFYVGVRICSNESEWKAAFDEFTCGPLSVGQKDRRKFYFKWATRFGLNMFETWEDVHLVHTEPFIPSRSEHQIEVVIGANGEYEIADTGDLLKHPQNRSCGITMFKTPGDFEITPVLKTWLNDHIQTLAKHGFARCAIDVEFFRLDGQDERYELVEINPRYSFMGFWKMLPDAKHSHEQLQKGNQHEVRNMLNRTRLALGAKAATLPLVHQPGWCKVAAFVYTDQKGRLSEIFNEEALTKLLENGTVDSFTPKPPYLAKKVTDEDLQLYHGWAKLCCLLFTVEKDKVSDTVDAAYKAVLTKVPDQLSAKLFR